MLYDHPEFDAHEQVRFLFDERSGLKAIHAVHKTRFGSSVGGIRCRDYRTDADALTDVLHLSRTMTFKAVMAGLEIGGAKTVMIGDPATARTPQRLHALGRYIDSLDGTYVCAPDVGTDSADMDRIGEVCRAEFISGMGQQGGTTAKATARGVFQALRGAVRAVLGREQLAGLRIAVQGAGGVGSRLTAQLTEAGALVSIADLDAARAEQVAARTGARAVSAEEILFGEADVLSPNALGGIFDRATIERLKVPLICGAANTQLASRDAAEQLQAAGIAWVPDYVVSPGGIIAAFRMIGRLTEEQYETSVARIYDTTLNLLQRARERAISPQQTASEMVRERLAADPPA